MKILNFLESDVLGTVDSVDTSTVIIKVQNDNKLHSIQINHLIAITSSNIGQHLIGLVSKIIRKSDNTDTLNHDNIIKVVLIGTHFEKEGLQKNIFNRTLTTVPTINAEAFLISGETLKKFMGAIATTPSNDVPVLKIGTYSIDNSAIAWLNGNKFFQRHAVIVGSTGSGKSWTVANILEQVAQLKSSNAVLFDIHGEYASLASEGFLHYKIASPNDEPSNSTVFLPYWLLTYEEMIALLLDRSDSNAPNQAMIFSKSVLEGKIELLKKENPKLATEITLDSPVPYNIQTILEQLNNKDNEMVPGSRTEKQGPYNGKLTRFIQRLENKVSDKRLNFMFKHSDTLLNGQYMIDLCERILKPAQNTKGGIKIIDFSEVPSDILPLMVSLLARILFTIQQWTDKENRHPIAIFCDEAHLYIPSTCTKATEEESVVTFERIAKEGRKYGISLVIISQRPSEVNKTVLSQSNNFIAMRLTNIDDQNVIKRLLPDSLGDYVDLLPILDRGEALIVGDACLLPSRIKISEPNYKPLSATVEYWDEWSKNESNNNIANAIGALRRQSKEVD